MTSASLLYVGSYATAEQPGISVFRHDPASGQLQLLHQQRGLLNPSYLALHPQGHTLYAASETVLDKDGQPGQVLALRLSPEGLPLHPLPAQASGGDSPCHLSVHPSGRMLYVANYVSGTVAALPLAEDGTPGPAEVLHQLQGQGPDPERQDGPHAHEVHLSPDGQWLLVPDLGSDRVVIFRLDPDGRPHLHGSAAMPEGTGPRHLAFAPDGQTCYLAGELGNSLTVFRFADGQLHQQQNVLLSDDAQPDWLPAEVHSTADGRHVLMSVRGPDTLAVFSVQPDGHLQLEGHVPCGTHWPRHFCFSPDGRQVLVAGERGDTVTRLDWNGSQLGQPQPLAQLGQPTHLLFG
ncbi:lactonase family protein [Deinococcus sonorensis]|uniref:Lactonase family protein n=2 Tax=Deinococcus sonorensis TaxID=309891 RepID=A0AAU7U9S9_9DEIO